MDSFIEEAVVRRELADNFCWYQPQYDQLEGQSYAWATGTLNDHRADKRPYIYSLEKLEQVRIMKASARNLTTPPAVPLAVSQRRNFATVSAST